MNLSLDFYADDDRCLMLDRLVFFYIKRSNLCEYVSFSKLPNLIFEFSGDDLLNLLFLKNTTLIL
jgi:hypothetical protein